MRTWTHYAYNFEFVLRPKQEALCELKVKGVFKAGEILIVSKLPFSWEFVRDTKSLGAREEINHGNQVVIPFPRRIHFAKSIGIRVKNLSSGTRRWNRIYIQVLGLRHSKPSLPS